MNYDKGVLAEILEPIMGKGLIPADLETWKVRCLYTSNLKIDLMDKYKYLS